VEDVVREEGVLVRRDVEAVGVGPDVRVVTEARAVTAPVVAKRAAVVGRAVRAVVLGGQAIDRPRAERARRLAHGKIKVVLAREGAVRQRVEREYYVEPPPRVGVVEARRVRHEGSTNAGGPVDGRWIAVEGVLVDHAGERIARGVEDPDHIVHRLHHEPVAGTESLVRRLEGELVASVGETLLAVVQTIEAQGEFRVGLRLLAAVGGRAVAGTA
jgi:hypothetical protein